MSKVVLKDEVVKKRNRREYLENKINRARHHCFGANISCGDYNHTEYYKCQHLVFKNNELRCLIDKNERECCDLVKYAENWTFYFW